MKALFEKLGEVAATVAAEKGELYFFGLVHRVDAPDRWDLLVSSEQLEPWSLKALNYLVERLRKVLADQEMVEIARIVSLPRDNKVIKRLSQDDQIRLGNLGVPQDDQFDRAFVIRRLESARRPAAHRAGA
jgi:hypothetical protein